MCSYHLVSSHSSKINSIVMLILLSEVTSEDGINQLASILAKRYQHLSG